MLRNLFGNGIEFELNLKEERKVKVKLLLLKNPRQDLGYYELKSRPHRIIKKHIKCISFRQCDLVSREN